MFSGSPWGLALSNPVTEQIERLAYQCFGEHLGKHPTKTVHLNPPFPFGFCCLHYIGLRLYLQDIFPGITAKEEPVPTEVNTGVQDANRLVNHYALPIFRLRSCD